MNQKKDTRTQKSYVTVGVITLVAVIALAGISYRKTASRESEEQEAVVMAEAEWTEDDEANGDVGASEDSSVAKEDVGALEDSSAAKEEADETESDSADSSDDGQAESDLSGNESDDEQDETDSVEGEVDSTAVVSGAESLSFSEADSLSWPLQGDVILNYSMDQSVYFATLDQYKYNPALVIAGEVSDQVTAAAAGQVVSVETSEETGETVTMDIGSGYQLVYGQLKEVQVSEGDMVAKGDLIGFLSEPTKYYSVEGCNLYFQMTKDGESINPLFYLESSSAE